MKSYYKHLTTIQHFGGVILNNQKHVFRSLAFITKGFIIDLQDFLVNRAQINLDRKY